MNEQIMQKYFSISSGLSPHQKKWYEEKFNYPVEKSGWVYYRFKKETTYPARIYVFINGEKWRDRNLGAMGLRGSSYFLKRPMTKGELEDAHFYTRLKYYQYENWKHLLEHEQEISLEWVEQHEQISASEFMVELTKFSKLYQIGKNKL